MKTIKKTIPAIILTVAICLTLGGCKELDEEKASQAFWSDSINSNIVWDNAVYVRLQNNFEKYNISFTRFGKSIFVTEKDVPVLLSNMFSSLGTTVSKDKKLMISDDNRTIYCREDYVDDFNDIIKDIKYDDYFFNYYDPNAEFNVEELNDDDFFDNSQKEIMISKKDIEAIKKIAVKKNSVDKLKKELFEYTDNSDVKIEAYSVDKIFSKTLYDVVKYENNIYLCVSDYTEESTEYSAVYKVPKKYLNIFAPVNDYL